MTISWSFTLQSQNLNSYVLNWTPAQESNTDNFKGSQNSTGGLPLGSARRKASAKTLPLATQSIVFCFLKKMNNDDKRERFVENTYCCWRWTKGKTSGTQHKLTSSYEVVNNNSLAYEEVEYVQTWCGSINQRFSHCCSTCKRIHLRLCKSRRWNPSEQLQIFIERERLIKEKKTNKFLRQAKQETLTSLRESVVDEDK